MPPTRDEESETQRKAHAKRVRETRRSTQGVTLDEIKSAEQLVKMKNANNNTNSTNSSGNVSTVFMAFYLYLFGVEKGNEGDYYKVMLRIYIYC